MDPLTGANGEKGRAPRKGDALRPHLASLRRPENDVPDFTRSILSEVGKQRAWLDSRERRMVMLGRIAAVAAAIVVAAGVYFVQRETRIEEIATGPAPRPIGELVRSVSDEAQKVDVRAALDGGAALGRVVFTQPLAVVVNASEASRGTASVWSVQWLAMPLALGAPVSGGAPEMAIAGFSGFSGVGQGNEPRSFMASQSLDTASWQSTIVVPAAFEVDGLATSRTLTGDRRKGP